MPSARTNERSPSLGAGRLLGQVAAMGVRAVDEFDSEAIERGQQRVDAVGALDFIGQIAADFFVGEMALGLGLGDEVLQIVIDTLQHRSTPPALPVRLG